MSLFNLLYFAQSLKVLSFFFTNRIGTPQGDLLGFIYPLFKRSFNCCSNSSYLVKENQRGTLEMGFASDTKSIARSISLVGGKPSSFARKTLKYVSKSFPTISFEPSSFTSSFIGSCTLMVNKFSSFCTHFLNCLT